MPYDRRFKSIEAKTEDLYFQTQIFEDVPYHMAIVSEPAGTDTIDHKCILNACPVCFNEVAKVGL